jgi:tRNA(Arg) A34 adenosine deaminase TadA
MDLIPPAESPRRSSDPESVIVEPGSPWSLACSSSAALSRVGLGDPIHKQNLKDFKDLLRSRAKENGVCIFLNETVPKKSKHYRADESTPERLHVISDAGHHIFETSIFNLIGATEVEALYLAVSCNEQGVIEEMTKLKHEHRDFEFNRQNLYGLNHPHFWTSWQFWFPNSSVKTESESQSSGFKCVACCSMYPGIDIQGTIQEHVDTSVHRIAMKAAVACHALSAIENRKIRKHFDLALWYAHHDKVPHQCQAIKVVDDFIGNVTHHCRQDFREARDLDFNRRNMDILVKICDRQEGLKLGELSESAFKKQMQETKSTGNTQGRFFVDISAECIFRSVGFETLCDVVKRNFDNDGTDTNDGSPFELFSALLEYSQKIPKRIRDNGTEEYTKSFPTWNWIIRNSGQSVKQRGHRVKHVYEACEVERTKNFGEKWRHLIFSYSICSLQWVGFNGNKEGPVGSYPARQKQKAASIHQIVDSSDSKKTKNLGIYRSKEGGPSENYVGHNIVAIAVGKRGDILKVAYNHNILFTSTVDHAEERLIDSLYKDPAAFVQRSHSEILDENQKVDIEKHMQHISVYTSLEPCQQCSGKLHVALVPELIFCQRDWEIQLTQVEMYEKFRKCRPIPASQFGYPPYVQLARSYYHFMNHIESANSKNKKIVFFETERKTVLAKKTMPYFLCTDECHDIIQQGHIVFKHLFGHLFKAGIDNEEIQCVLDELVLNHGLDSKSAADWGGDFSQIKRIQEYRPSLDHRQKRILQDDLHGKRNQWIDARHDQFCSLHFKFESSIRISEEIVDRYLSPLADITSIYLAREIDGSLKGDFKVTFSDRKSATELKRQLHLAMIDKNADDMASQSLGRANSRKSHSDDLLQKALDWLHQIRVIKSHEVFLPAVLIMPELKKRKNMSRKEWEESDEGKRWGKLFGIPDARQFYRMYAQHGSTTDDVSQLLNIHPGLGSAVFGSQLMYVTKRFGNDSGSTNEDHDAWGWVFSFCSEFSANLLRHHYSDVARLDSSISLRHFHSFSLTTKDDVVDTAVLSYVQSIFAARQRKPVHLPIVEGIQVIPSPKVTQFKANYWDTCGQMKWLDVFARNPRSVRRRKIWKVSLPENCLDSLLETEDQIFKPGYVPAKFHQPYSTRIFDHVWCHQKYVFLLRSSSERFPGLRVGWDPPAIPNMFYGTFERVEKNVSIHQSSSNNQRKYLICILDIQKENSDGDIKKFVGEWLLLSLRDVRNSILRSHFDLFDDILEEVVDFFSSSRQKNGLGISSIAQLEQKLKQEPEELAEFVRSLQKSLEDRCPSPVDVVDREKRRTKTWLKQVAKSIMKAILLKSAGGKLHDM